MWNPFRRKEKSLQSPSGHGSRGGWFPIIGEAFPGAWQRNLEIRQETVLAYNAVFSCMSLISGDISKMPASLMKRTKSGIWQPEAEGELPRLLRKPNSFQNRMQFFECWVNSKLAAGNTYVIKIRNTGGRVVELRILDPLRVTPLVSPDGQVFYRVSPDNLSGLTDEVIVPAREVIHDRFNCLFHPLVGLSPIFACGLPATQGNSILENSTVFFQNGGKPSGIISLPGSVSEEKAREIKANWDAGYTGANAGKTAVLSDGADYKPNSMTAADAQTIEQLKLAGEIVCAVFHVPTYKVGIDAAPKYDNIEALEQQYYSQCLQTLIEAIELSLNDAFDLGIHESVEFETDALLRMDTERRYTTYSTAVGCGILAPNEARLKENLPPVPGGDFPYMQQQNYSLEALARRDATADPFGKPAVPEVTPPPDLSGNKRLSPAEYEAIRAMVKGSIV
ncbi:phage portal protein [Dryocola sp. LX212]